MIGRILSGYEILEQLGEGSMGVVYKARDQQLGRLVALKVLHRRLADSAEFVARFEREAKTISALNHPNIATIYGVGQAEGQRFLILEYLPGGTLRSKLEALGNGVMLPASQVIDYALQIAQGLGHAHRRGVVHRDVKTDNVLLTDEGGLKVTDFGVAKIDVDLGLTEEGSLVGTMAYMSPEQVQGIQVDHRSDIYSFGVVVYEVATRQLPFQSFHSAALIYDIVNSAPPAAAQLRPDIPATLDRVIGECLRKPPEQRPASMADVADALEALWNEVRSTTTSTRHDLAAAAEPAGLAAGRSLGHYKLEAKIGEGGMGVVYKARDTRLDRAVALKVLSAQAVANPQRKKRFVQEAKAASALNHPNIVTIHDISESGGFNYIAMEYIAGKTLDRVITGNGAPLAEALRYAVQIADALAMAHMSGIVHRDIKPANVMITPDGLVKLLDFGLAKLTEPAGNMAGSDGGEALSQTPHTEEGAILGTVAYMSPEQAEGKPVDARSDIFSFGSLLYEMVTGRRAFRGESKISVLASILHHDPPPVREIAGGVPSDVERIILRCLRKDPNRRSQHMADVKVALQEALDEWNSTHSSVALPGRAPAIEKQRNWLGLGLAFLAGALLIAIVTGVWRSSPNAAGQGAPGILAPVAAELMLTRLTGSETLGLSPSWSPDGAWICYASDRAGNLDLWKRPLLGGDEVQLTSTPRAETQPAWAPDGRAIAFSIRGRDGGIFLIPAEGGQPVRVAEFGANPAWSPDSQTLAFDWNGGVYVVPYTGGEPRLLTAGTSATPHAVWSPDGSRIVFWSRTQGDLLSLNIDDESTTPLGLIPAGEEVAGLSWSGDGRWLVFSRGSFGGNKDLWRVEVDPRTGKPLGEALRLTLSSTDDVQCRISNDGLKIAYTAQQVERHLWSFSREPASGMIQGEPQRITLVGERNYYPAVSPDGQSLLWTSQNAGQGMIYHKRFGENQERKLTAERGRGIREVGASFGPDGLQIVYSSTVGGSYQLWRMPSFDTVALQLTRTQQPARDTQTAWSPDGEKIAFYSNRSGNWDIWTIAPNGGEPQRLTDWGSNEVYPAWSPDSAKLAFLSNHEGNPDLWVLDTRNNQSQVYVQHPAEEGPGGWSPDGRWFYFSSNRSGEFNIWKMPAAGGEAQPVTTFEGGDMNLPETALFTKFAVTATRLIVPLETREGGVYVLESFPQE